MHVPAAILARLDRIMAELAELRAELVASMPAATVNGAGAEENDFAEHCLIDPASAHLRLGVPQDTLRKWARETADTEQAVGIRRGGRWVLSIPRLRRRIG